jgi:hypothetical protein
MAPLALQLAVEESKVTPGLLGFVVVAALGIATWFLLKSMNKQLKRVDFEDRDQSADADRANHKEGNGAPAA